MIINLDRDLETALNDLAHRRGIAPEVLALQALRERFLPLDLQFQPRDD
jgi:hypothetical protein